MNQPNPYEAPSSFVDENPYDSYTSEEPWDLPPLATRGSRLAAAIVDGLAYAAPMILFMVLYTTMVSGSFAAGYEDTWTFLLVVGIPGLAVGCYNLYLLHENGQTIGKKAMNIKIIRSDRQTRVTVGRVILARFLPIWLAGMVPIIGRFVGLINVLFIFGEERKCIHDRFADTVVVDDSEYYSSRTVDANW